MSHAQDPPVSTPPGSKPSGSTGRVPYGDHDARGAWAAGGTVFAAMMLLIGGVLAVLEGVVGISRDAIFVATRGDYPYKFDVRAWGGIHLVLGVIAVLVGYGLLRGAARARYAGIAIDTSAIWALATFRPADARRGSMR